MTKSVSVSIDCNGHANVTVSGPDWLREFRVTIGDPSNDWTFSHDPIGANDSPDWSQSAVGPIAGFQPGDTLEVSVWDTDFQYVENRVDYIGPGSLTMPAACPTVPTTVLESTTTVTAPEQTATLPTIPVETVPDTTVPQAKIGTAPAPVCQEDAPCWDCSTMGNQLCGPTTTSTLITTAETVVTVPGETLPATGPGAALPMTGAGLAFLIAGAGLLKLTRRA